MPNNITNLENSIRNLLADAVRQNVDGAATLLAALDVAFAAEAVTGRTPTSSGCACRPESHQPTVRYNKKRTIFKLDAPGFTNESLCVTLRSFPSGDEFVVVANNRYRPALYKSIKVNGRVDRSSIEAQLRYGVLKVSGRTYTSSTPECEMNLGTIDFRPEMKN